MNKKTFPVTAPEANQNEFSTDRPDESEDIQEVQTQLDKFTFYVDQAKAARQVRCKKLHSILAFAVH